MDKLSPQQWHNNMAAIHGKDTKPEMVVRRWLWGVDSVIGLIIPTAGEARYCDAEVQDVYLCKWLLLARA